MIHFSEDRQQARMPWTDPLPNILHLKPSFGSESYSCSFLSDFTRYFFFSDDSACLPHMYIIFFAVNGKLRIVRQRVLSSMKPDFANNLIEGACFYQIVTRNTRHKFVSFFFFFLLNASSPDYSAAMLTMLSVPPENSQIYASLLTWWQDTFCYSEDWKQNNNCYHAWKAVYR